ncbi:hypothetical protein GCM10009687_30830 [Asanoa iriomotensis]|uniref:Uncharacterized protein n=1 Tax=Asanoa iriomotensis TaxID=234613 RepID=A0ABQ4BYF1_9ACTN|nr:hypothetical protein Air01nite_16320 [Asanoa iriomotensis]
MLWRPELAIDREPEYVTIEALTALAIDRAEQDAAGEYLHRSNMPCHDHDQQGFHHRPPVPRGLSGRSRALSR